MDGKVRIGPQQRRDVSIITLEEAKRVDRFVMKVGSCVVAAARLRVGYNTVLAARHPGSALLASTKTKLLDALEREERAA